MCEAYEAAKAAGAVYYDSGAPCRNGHYSLRYTRSKVCVACHKAAMSRTKERHKERHALEMERRAAARAAESERLRPQREQANKERIARWRKENAAHVKAVNDIWRAENAERQKQTTLQWRKENQKKCREYTAAWAARNPDKERQRRRRQYESMTPEERRERQAEFHAKNPDARRRYNSDYKARKLANGGVLSKDIIEKLLVLQRGKCACCRKPLGKDFHLDHIVPLNLGGPNCDDNVQLLRKRCNLTKNAKHPVDYMQSKGFLL